MKTKFINWLIKILKVDTNQISDGYHTFGDLYEHRIRLWIKLCSVLEMWPETFPWCSTRHSDGSSFGDWFILGVGKKKGQQITYHLPAKYWNEVCDFAEVLPKAPKWDGHTPEDVLKRLETL